MPLKKRSSFLSVDALPLKQSPIIIWGYDRKKKFACRLQIGAAGIAVYAGKGRELIADLSWERFVRKLRKANAPRKRA